MGLDFLLVKISSKLFITVMPRKNLGGGYTRSIFFSVVATLIYLESAAGWSENSPDLVDTLTNRGDGEDFQACNDQQFTCADSGNCIDKVGETFTA